MPSPRDQRAGGRTSRGTSAGHSGTAELPPFTGPATLSRLAVVGVRAAEATATLAGLLDAHHYTERARADRPWHAHQ